MLTRTFFSAMYTVGSKLEGVQRGRSQQERAQRGSERAQRGLKSAQWV